MKVRVLKKYSSPYSKEIKVLERSNKEKYLSTSFFVHGISIDSPSINGSYWEKIADLTLNHCEHTTNPKILMLGLGANTISGLINKKMPNIHQTIIEIDPFIIQACKEFFDLEKNTNCTIIQKDVFELIKEPSSLPEKFDVIIVDIFSDKPPFISLETGQPDFIKGLEIFAQEECLFIFNRLNHTKLAAENASILETYVRNEFKEVNCQTINDKHGYQNYIISAIIH